MYLEKSRITDGVQKMFAVNMIAIVISRSVGEETVR